MFVTMLPPRYPLGDQGRVLSESALGKISPEIILDNPDRMYYGPSDPIRGLVRISYYLGSHVNSGFEISGPCRIFLSVGGKLFLHIPARSDMPTAQASGKSIALCRTEHCIFDGQLPRLRDYHRQPAPGNSEDSSTRDFPFEVYVPSKISCEDYFEKDWGKDDGKGWADGFDTDPSQPMPPSMSFKISYGVDSAPATSVSYTVSARLEMRDNPVATGWHSVEIGYELERLDPRHGYLSEMQSQFGTIKLRTRTSMFSLPGALVIPNASTDKQPLRIKTTSVFRSLASSLAKGRTSQSAAGGLELGWQLSCSRELPRGQPLIVQVQFRPRHGNTGASDVEAYDDTGSPAIPEAIELSRLTILLEARIKARMKGESPGNKTNKARPGLPLVPQKYEAREIILEKIFAARVPNRSPGAAALISSDGKRILEDGLGLLDAGNGWSRVITLPDITKSLCSSFGTVFLQRSYRVKVQCHAQLPGQKRAEVFGQIFPLTIRAPVDKRGESGLLPELRGTQPSAEMNSGLALEHRAELGAMPERNIVELGSHDEHTFRAELGSGQQTVSRSELCATRE